MKPIARHLSLGVFLAGLSLPYFSYALTKHAPLKVYSDQSLDQRFRILVHDGHPDLSLNERIGDDYADPVKVVFIPSD